MWKLLNLPNRLPEELQSHAGSSAGLGRGGLLGLGEPGVSLAGSLEDASVTVTSEVLPLDLGNQLEVRHCQSDWILTWPTVPTE